MNQPPSSLPFRLLAAAMAALLLLTTCSYRRPVKPVTGSSGVSSGLAKKDIGKVVIVFLANGEEEEGRLKAIREDALEIVQFRNVEPLRISFAEIERIEVVEAKEHAKEAQFLSAFFVMSFALLILVAWQNGNPWKVE